MAQAPKITITAAQGEPREYEIRELFARGEARLLTLQGRMMNAGDNLEERVDASVDMLQLLTGADIGDLNSLHLQPLLKLIHEALGKYNEAYRPAAAAADGDQGNAGPPARG